MITKPISVARVEFLQNLNSLISESGLPPYIIEPMLGNYHRQIILLCEKQYKEDLDAYMETLNKTNEASK